MTVLFCRWKSDRSLLRGPVCHSMLCYDTPGLLPDNGRFTAEPKLHAAAGMHCPEAGCRVELVWVASPTQTQLPRFPSNCSIKPSYQPSLDCTPAKPKLTASLSISLRVAQSSRRALPSMTLFRSVGCQLWARAGSLMIVGTRVPRYGRSPLPIPAAWINSRASRAHDGKALHRSRDGDSGIQWHWPAWYSRL
jgi:hypothetical protein